MQSKKNSGPIREQNTLSLMDQFAAQSVLTPVKGRC